MQAMNSASTTVRKARQSLSLRAAHVTVKARASARRDRMLSSPSSVTRRTLEEIYLGVDGILDNLAPGAYVADMTTSSPSLAVRIYEEAKNAASMPSMPLSREEIWERKTPH